MSLLPRALPLPIHAPVPPDHWLCHRHFGSRPIIPLDCQTAIDTYWPNGRTPVPYFLRDTPRSSISLSIPSYEYLGSCRVALETAGPHEHLPASAHLKPQELRGLAGYLIQKCAVENGGIGGFLTMGFNSALSYIHNTTNEAWGGNFLTISIQPRWLRRGQTMHLEPGSHNANIAAVLAEHAAGLAAALANTGKELFYDAIALDLRNRALEMQGVYSPNLTWWCKEGYFNWWAARFDATQPVNENSSNNAAGTSGFLGDEEGDTRDGNATVSSTGRKDGESDGDEEGEGSAQGDSEDTATSPIRGQRGGGGGGGEEEGEGESRVGEGEGSVLENTDIGDMTYQCDDSLGGGPEPMDCEKLSWSGLKPPDSIETLKPSVPNFYSQGTCALGISSITPTTIAWAHLITAFETLNMFCVQNPIKSIKGGRAYFGKQRVSSWINGKIKRDAEGDSVNATEALPPGINATIFRHDTKSQMACEWTLAEEKKNLSSCRTG